MLSSAKPIKILLTTHSFPSIIYYVILLYYFVPNAFFILSSASSIFS